MRKTKKLEGKSRGKSIQSRGVGPGTQRPGFGLWLHSHAPWGAAASPVATKWSEDLKKGWVSSASLPASLFIFWVSRDVHPLEQCSAWLKNWHGHLSSCFTPEHLGSELSAMHKRQGPCIRFLRFQPQGLLFLCFEIGHQFHCVLCGSKD